MVVVVMAMGGGAGAEKTPNAGDDRQFARVPFSFQFTEFATDDDANCARWDTRFARYEIRKRVEAENRSPLVVHSAKLDNQIGVAPFFETSVVRRVPRSCDGRERS